MPLVPAELPRQAHMQSLLQSRSVAVVVSPVAAVVASQAAVAATAVSVDLVVAAHVAVACSAVIGEVVEARAEVRKAQTKP